MRYHAILAFVILASGASAQNVQSIQPAVGTIWAVVETTSGTLIGLTATDGVTTKTGPVVKAGRGGIVKCRVSLLGLEAKDWTVTLLSSDGTSTATVPTLSKSLGVVRSADAIDLLSPNSPTGTLTPLLETELEGSAEATKTKCRLVIRRTAVAMRAAEIAAKKAAIAAEAASQSAALDESIQ